MEFILCLFLLLGPVQVAELRPDNATWQNNGKQKQRSSSLQLLMPLLCPEKGPTGGLRASTCCAWVLAT